MRQFYRTRSLAAQIIVLASICLIVTSAVALICASLGLAGAGRSEVRLIGLIIALALTSLACLCLIVYAVQRLLLPLRRFHNALAQLSDGDLAVQCPNPMPNREFGQLGEVFSRLVDRLRGASEAQERARHALATRTLSVDRLLEFSQTVQGAGQSEQVYTALAHFLEKELCLSGVAILSHDASAIPPVVLKTARPEAIVNPGQPIAEMNADLCPCLRQNLSKSFRPDASPIRCSIDSCINVPQSNPAFCTPFHIGQNMQGVVHMMLPDGEVWDDERTRLAQTYVNAACSTLISLHLVEEAEKQSLTDPLTGLYNRHSMEKLMQREVALCERHTLPLSIVMVDMDYFKSVNDEHGHAAGDHMLKSFADCVRMTLRKTDLAFRFGGDEFLIVLPQTAIVQAQQVVQKLRQAYAAVDFSHAITRLDRQPTLSIGVAERSRDGNILTLDAMLSAADQALYEAKNANRNCIRIFSPQAA